MARQPRICPAKMARILTLAGSVTGATRPELASILRRENISDDAGGFVGSWNVAQSNIPARVKAQGMQPWEKVDKIEGRPIAVSVFIIAMPAGTDVRPTDRVRVDTFSPALTYEVIGTDGPASYEVERSVQAVRVQ